MCADSYGCNHTLSEYDGVAKDLGTKGWLHLLISMDTAVIFWRTRQSPSSDDNTGIVACT